MRNYRPDFPWYVQTFLLSFLLIFVSNCSENSSTKKTSYTDAVRLNQVGYYPISSKKAIISTPVNATDFEVVNVSNMKTVWTGELSESLTWELAGETVKIADFSAFKEEGSFMLYVEGIGYSYPFEVKPAVLNEAFKAAIKGQYYQRAGMALEEDYAYQWERALGHPDDSVLFHQSTGRSGVTSSTKGWYDAGDFGKYVVNGAVSLGQMMSYFEQYPDNVSDGDLSIPESGNGISDMLDEFKYELDWLLTMQDEDGGVFFKLTTKGFEGMVMPEEAVKPRYIIGKGTAPSLDFAAVMAKAARLFADVDQQYAQTCRKAAEKAWDWAIANEAVIYSNPEDISTGEYGDSNFSQEFYWAAAELFITTASEEYSEFLNSSNMDFTFVSGESWANYMHFIGAFALVDNLEANPLSKELQLAIVDEADRLVKLCESNAYFQPVADFQWGSNSDVLNTAMIIAQAYRINADTRYLRAVEEITAYIFGKNATGYSFLTGFGSKTPLYIHHRQSSADGIPEPVPGLLSGGPNSAQQDKGEVDYPDNVAPMKSWMDVEPSFASNEVCLNWNSAAVYVLGFLEAETAKLQQ